MKLSRHDSKCTFTRLHANIVEEDGAFTVQVRMLNHLQTEERAWGEEVAKTFDIASAMIEALACEFSIAENCISLNIVMSRFKDGTRH